MNNLIPLEFQNQRIITTKVLAEEFGTEEKNIQMNFSRNEERFVDGKHYYKLEGQQLKFFKDSLPTESREPIKFAPVLYLWTEKGAARHAKILDTDEAWEVYEELEETYFRVKNGQPNLEGLSPQLQALINVELEQKKINQRINEVNHKALEAKAKSEKLEERMDNQTLSTAQTKKIKKIANKIAVPLVGGKGSNAYEPMIRKVYKDIYKQLFRELGVNASDEIKVKDFNFALEVMENYKIATALKNEIDMLNNQSKLNIQ
ncbi:ORF6N domain-containing protein [Clostridium perfringens]|uniref:ORF6N domain-containing protein n=1 Tax=Clostridium perfringens TaxID=1502 RepID=UPI001B830375|nr:ORF6C domain-containing protein [Clostridium perfringens]MDT7986958.1 ORF6C domain-containing protein [Clostridium perfringens]HBC2031025.1 ORF6C domain-containing protein [Clostridium perfringens]HBC2034374.1 ORF6C domain-containing protein [Clostridium perfringens]HBC2057444.1 ORF6C domain-containing protein [Clostridium perfringens]HBC2071653.1 ORF6C domain-containing protein [Clostridium perfringens]